MQRARRGSGAAAAHKRLARALCVAAIVQTFLRTLHRLKEFIVALFVCRRIINS
jgi:hypothetical protein